MKDANQKMSEFEAKAKLYGFLTGLFKTLANPTRLQILALLSGKNEGQEKLGNLLLIYCATPARFAGKKKKIMDFVTKQGHGPFHPFQAFEYERFEGGPVGRKKTIEFCCRAIDICDEFWLFGISEGTLTELCHALKRNKTVRLFLNEYDKDWRKEYEKLKDKFNDPLVKIN